MPSIFVCYDDDKDANPQYAIVLSRHLSKLGYDVSAYNGQPFEEKSVSVYNEIDPIMVQSIQKSRLVVLCLSRQFQHNIRCKKISLYAMDYKEKSPQAGEVVFVLMQGDYTMRSIPYPINGWMRHMIKDSVSYSAWSKSSAVASAEAVAAVITLKTKQIVVDNVIDKWTKLVDPEKSPKSRGRSRSRSRSPAKSPATAETTTLSNFDIDL